MIYLDYAATAPLRPAIAAALGELHGEALGNPSSLHRAGRRARFHLEQARERCAQALGAKVEEIVFCSGATEADNLAVLGPLWHQDARHRGLITSALEHAAVYETAHKARSLGQQVNWLQVTSQGQVDLDSLRDALIRQPRSLVSVMACNNEVGSRQPLDAVSDLCREHGSLLHVDAVQEPAAAVRLIREARADLLTLSGHKMGGLPGATDRGRRSGGRSSGGNFGSGPFGRPGAGTGVDPAGPLGSGAPGSRSSGPTSGQLTGSAPVGSGAGGGAGRAYL